ncbi:hypothetical protein BDP81DRAFT_418804 [Colletotrichum phormii]|uniref:Uncharacterized protein n=1 Tax=Colletotrichum phormii TaxID=359342 RepID=A0AAJ0A3G1_9PEZI|nr:uncharacterized protein BDP81DRAFT_418804 [Colletotrichum phormii]KAK1641387.1 hypothetical protein BDP81DRAFT_418804 [Colletotrichum phormii]
MSPHRTESRGGRRYTGQTAPNVLSLSDGLELCKVSGARCRAVVQAAASDLRVAMMGGTCLGLGAVLCTGVVPGSGLGSALGNLFGGIWLLLVRLFFT